MKADIRDRKYIRAFKQHKDPEELYIQDLKTIKVVNLIIPAWNEGEVFRKCLESITKLKYPKLKIIVNAGGSEETINIANSFKKNENFLILSQEGRGKLEAINKCFEHVSEGIVYLIDADINLNDEILLRMIYPLVNLKENVVIGGIRPLKSQEPYTLTKFLQINRGLNFHEKFTRYRKTNISGANTCLNYEVIRAIGKFSTDKIYAVEASQSDDILSKGYSIYRLSDYRGRIYTKMPSKIKEWVQQELRWNENVIVYSLKHKKKTIIKFLFLLLYSIYIFTFPFLFLIHPTFLLIGLFLLLNIYMNKIRRLIFYRIIYGNDFKNIGLKFFIVIIFYIYIEAIIRTYTAIELLIFRSKKLQQRKNIQKSN